MIEIDKKIKEKMKSKDYVILLKPTHDCNIHCSYCYDRIAQKRHGKGIMTKETFMRVIDMINKDERKCSQFIFHGGEPLMAGYEWYEWALKYLKENYNKDTMPEISMQSNGRLLNKKFIDLFNKYNISVGLSYDFYPEDVVGFRQNINDERIKELINYNNKKNKGVIGGTICVLSKKNINYLKNALKNKIGFNNIALNFLFPTEEINESQKNMFFTKEEYANAIESLINIYKIEGEISIERGCFQLLSILNGGNFTCCNRTDCRYGWVGVGPTGTIAHCDTYTYGPFYLGTIYDYEEITDFQYSSGYANIVSARDEKRNLVCKYCKLNDVCRGTCFSNNLNSNNTAFSLNTNACNEIKYGMFGVYKSIRKYNIYDENINTQISKAFISNDYYSPVEIQKVIKDLFDIDYLENDNTLISPDRFFCSKEYLIYRKINPVLEKNCRVNTFNFDNDYSSHINKKVFNFIFEHYTGTEIKKMREMSIVKTIINNRKYFENILGKEVIGYV